MVRPLGGKDAFDFERRLGEQRPKCLVVLDHSADDSAG